MSEGTTDYVPWRDPKPMPDGFVETFIRFGWRGVELFFGSRTSCNKRWVEQAGGADLIERRRQYRERVRHLRRRHVGAA